MPLLCSSLQCLVVLAEEHLASRLWHLASGAARPMPKLRDVLQASANAKQDFRLCKGMDNENSNNKAMGTNKKKDDRRKL